MATDGSFATTLNSVFAGISDAELSLRIEMGPSQISMFVCEQTFDDLSILSESAKEEISLNNESSIATNAQLPFLVADVRGDDWQISDSSGEIFATFLPLVLGQGLAVHILAADLDLLGSIYVRPHSHPASSIGRNGNRRDVALIRDDGGDAVGIMRADGPTGTHVVDKSGKVVALSSRTRPASTVEALILRRPFRGTPMNLVSTHCLLLLSGIIVNELVTDQHLRVW